MRDCFSFSAPGYSYKGSTGVGLNQFNDGRCRFKSPGQDGAGSREIKIILNFLRASRFYVVS